MFEVGMQELALIFVVALVVLGPQRLPKLVAQVGRWVGKARHMARQFHDQLESEINLEELSKAKAREPAPSPPPATVDPLPESPPAEATGPNAATEPAFWAQPSSLAGVAPPAPGTPETPDAPAAPAEVAPAPTPTYTETHERAV
jgi:sec-independent protein translocase protein TatB